MYSFRRGKCAYDSARRVCDDGREASLAVAPLIDVVRAVGGSAFASRRLRGSCRLRQRSCSDEIASGECRSLASRAGRPKQSTARRC